jgi:hypothetical protein
MTSAFGSGLASSSSNSYSRTGFLLFFLWLFLLFATSVIAGVGAGTGESKNEGRKGDEEVGMGQRRFLSVRPYSPKCAKSNFTVAQTLFCLYLEQTAA